MYVLQWKNPSIDTGKINTINVPAGSTVSSASSLVFTGKGAANYGKVQQENMMRLLENFADTTPPSYPTVGQLWYDAGSSTLKILVDSNPVMWKSVGGFQITDASAGPPPNPSLGDLWFEKTGDLSGYLYVYNKIGRFPYSLTTNGGWSQIWPRVDAAGLRFEYDQVFGQVETLLSTRTTQNLFPNVPFMTVLDAHLQNIVSSFPDEEINQTGATPQILAQPVSYDWDALLSAARWAVSRLDVPATTWDDVSSFPFVQDGRQVLDYLVSNYSGAGIDVRATPSARRSSQLLGSITLHRLYAETVNVLSAVLPLRYTLRGMAGASGTLSQFSPDVTTNLHCRRAGNWTDGSPVTVVTEFRWNSAADRDQFINGGNAIEITVKGSGGTDILVNTSLYAFLNRVGRIRVTADMVRWFNSAEPPQMTEQPSQGGLLSVTASTSTVALGSQAGDSNSINLSGVATPTGLSLSVTVNAPAGLNGQLEVSYAVVRDRTVFGTSETQLYPAPLIYNQATDSAGTSSVLQNVSIIAPPVANFSVNGSTGPEQIIVSQGSNVTFTWTGTGNPTLIEWDFDGNGNFTATGTTVTTTFTIGRKSPRVRATNTSGSDILFRTAKIRAI